MCTRDKEFTIRGIDDCLARGYERAGFFEVDTGEQRSWTVQLTESSEPAALRVDADIAERTARSTDLSRALAQLKPRERQMLWLAYAQGESHKAIAETLGLKVTSIKLLLFRARRKLAALLKEVGS